jgi:hypothetical protein
MLDSVVQKRQMLHRILLDKNFVEISPRPNNRPVPYLTTICEVNVRIVTKRYLEGLLEDTSYL